MHATFSMPCHASYTDTSSSIVLKPAELQVPAVHNANPAMSQPHPISETPLQARTMHNTDPTVVRAVSIHERCLQAYTVQNTDTIVVHACPTSDISASTHRAWPKIQQRLVPSSC